MRWLRRIIAGLLGNRALGADALLRRRLEAALRRARATECAAAAELALGREDLPGAERAVGDGLGHQPAHEHLLELKARCAMIHGRAAAAVEILDRLEGAGRRDARVRLLGKIARCQAGQADAAMLDLIAWSRQEDCPAQARVLLAALHQQRGDLESARRTLARNIARGPDVLTCQLQVLLDVQEDLPISTHRAAGYLAHAFIDETFSARFLSGMDLAQRNGAVSAPIEMIEQLAVQLAHRPGVIPTLIAAQKHQPAAGRIDMLRRALQRIADEVEDRARVAEALAELAELAGDIDDARRWARRGLRLAPYSVALALLLDRIGSGLRAEDDLQSLDALRKAAAARPSYADVRRALIRRYQAAGFDKLARRAAERWLAEQPDNPQARAAFQELGKAA